MLQLMEKTAEPVGRVIAPQAASAPPPADDPRVDLKDLIRVLKAPPGDPVGRGGASVDRTHLRPGRDPLYTTTTQILIDPRDRRIVNNEVTPEDAGGRRRRRGRRKPVAGSHLGHRAAPGDRAAEPRHRSRNSAARPSACAKTVRDVLGAIGIGEGRPRPDTDGAAPAQAAHRREALRQGLRGRRVRDQRDARQGGAHR